VEGKAIFRLIRAKVQHETKIQIVKANVQHETKIQIAKANVQHETKIQMAKANVQHENSIPPGESGRVARYEKSIYRMMGEEAAGDLVRTDLWRDHDGAEGARLKS